MLDGEGNPWIRADLAIRGGRFVRIGRVDGRGRTEIDAAGKYVGPGWIDMLDQSGEVLPKNGRAENKLREGVTTAIAGEAGTPVPAGQLSGWLAGLERSGISLNFGTSYSETQARVAVLGQSARAPDAGELARMRAVMDTAMRGGAMGMTTALIYPPATYSTTDELAEVARAAARYGGIYATHVRGEGREVVRSVEEAIAIGERAGLPVEIFHLKVAYRPGWGTLMDSVGRTIEAARARGVDVAADLYVYTAGGTVLAATIPSWAFEGGADSLRARLAVRARLKREVVTGSPGWWNIVEAAGGWDNIVLAGADPANARYEGQSIAQIARATGKDPADAAWDLVAQGRGGGPGAIYHLMGEQDIETALRFPWTSIGSDASGVLRVPAPGETGGGAPAELRQLPARDRALRARAARAHAARGGAQDDWLARDAHAPRQPRHDRRRQLGRRDDLRLRHAAGPRDVRAADGVPDRHRVGARERGRHRRPRPAHRRDGRPRALGPGALVTDAGPPRTLRRTLRLRDLVLIAVGTVIGSGIFIVPAAVLRQTGGSVGVALLVWVVAGVLSLLGALTYGEMGAARPEAGGLYAYVRDAFGPLPAFLYGWTAFFVIASGSVATLAVAFAGYAQAFVPLSPAAAKVVAVLMILAVMAVNVRGTRQGADV